jgi:hypothetical protein
MKEEPEILEIRRVRAKLWKEGGGTIKGMVKMLRESQDAREAAREIVVSRKNGSARSTSKKKLRAA